MADKAEKLLRALARSHPVAGQGIVLPSFLSLDLAKYFHRTNRPTSEIQGHGLERLERKFSWLSHAWAQSEEELLYLVFDYLLDTAGYVAGARLEGTPDKHIAFVIKSLRLVGNRCNQVCPKASLSR